MYIYHINTIYIGVCKYIFTHTHIAEYIHHGCQTAEPAVCC